MSALLPGNSRMRFVLMAGLWVGAIWGTGLVWGAEAEVWHLAPSITNAQSRWPKLPALPPLAEVESHDQ